MNHPMTAKFSRQMRWGWLFLVALSSLLLSGCNSMRIIESQVQTSTQWPTGTASQTAVPAKAFFRLDRLPADVNNLQAGWAEVELEAALAPLGWTRNDIQAQYTIWIGVRVAEFVADPWGRPVRSPWTNRISVNIGTATTGLTAWAGALACALVFHRLQAMRKKSASSFGTCKPATWCTKQRPCTKVLGQTIRTFGAP